MRPPVRSRILLSSEKGGQVPGCTFESELSPDPLALLLHRAFARTENPPDLLGAKPMLNHVTDFDFTRGQAGIPLILLIHQG